MHVVVELGKKNSYIKWHISEFQVSIHFFLVKVFRVLSSATAHTLTEVYGQTLTLSDALNSEIGNLDKEKVNSLSFEFQFTYSLSKFLSSKFSNDTHTNGGLQMNSYVKWHVELRTRKLGQGISELPEFQVPIHFFLVKVSEFRVHQWHTH